MAQVPYPNSAQRAAVVERLRELCLGLPDTSERPSHGAPTFFIGGKRSFVTVMDDHHHDGRFAIWCAAPPGDQELLIAADPDRYFRPPYVGHRGWVGVLLHGALDWDEVAGVVEDAFMVAGGIAPA